MKVALYDRLPIDDLAAYQRLADVVLCSRFRPHSKVAPDADLVLQTWSRVPDTGVPVVSLGGGRQTRHLRQSPVYQAPRWQSHDTAHAAVCAVLTYGDRHRPVAVVGVGRIGSRVARLLLRCGWQVHLVHLGDDLPEDTGTITMHLADTPEADGWLGHQVLLADYVAAVVNVARPGQVDRDWIYDMLQAGTVGRYVVDGGQPLPHPWVVHTPHSAWDGHRSRVLRPRVVQAILRDGTAGLPLLSAPYSTVVPD